jgi:hypothetical protein
MKKTFSLLLITIGLLILSINFVNAVFKPTAQLTNMRLKVGDFVAPPVVELDNKLIMSLKSVSQISWAEVNDYKKMSEPVYYRLSISGKEYKVNNNIFLLDQESYPTGDYFFKIKACDQLNNCSDWSQQGQFSVIEPIKRGDVNTFIDYYQISDINSINYWHENYLEVKISNSLVEQFEFDYLTESTENLMGFDQTKLIISINDEPVFIENDVQANWQQVSLSLAEYNDIPITIKFYSGNQGDRQFSSWVKIKDINFFEQTTQEIANQLEIKDKLNILGIYY